MTICTIWEYSPYCQRGSLQIWIHFILAKDFIVLKSIPKQEDEILLYCNYDQFVFFYGNLMKAGIII